MEGTANEKNPAEWMQNVSLPERVRRRRQLVRLSGLRLFAIGFESCCLQETGGLVVHFIGSCGDSVFLKLCPCEPKQKLL
jgi:hypothetical protein